MPRTSKQFEAMREKSKKHIIEVAMQMFATRGYHSTSINIIAKKADIAVGLIYNYYESKEALLQEIMVYAMNKYNERMIEVTKEAIANLNLIEMIGAAYIGISNEVDTWLLFIRAMTEVRGIDFGELSDDYYFEKLEEIAAYHFKKQGIKNYEQKADMLCELVYGLVLDFVISRDQESFKKTLDSLVEFVILT